MKRISTKKWVAGAVAVSLVAAGAFLLGPPPNDGGARSSVALADPNAQTIAVTDPVHGRPFDVSIWSPRYR